MAKFFKFFVRAEHTVDVFVVFGVVLVIAVRREYGIEINCLDIKGTQIGKFFYNTFKITAEKVSVGNSSVLFLIVRLLSPLAQNLVFGGNHSPHRAESVYHYLIAHSGVEPARSVVHLLVNAQLPGNDVTVKQLRAAAVGHTYILFVCHSFHAEVVPVQSFF